MKGLKLINHNGQILLVAFDEQGLFVESKDTMKYYAKELHETSSILTNEEILNINDELLKEKYPSIYGLIHGVRL